MHHLFLDGPEQVPVLCRSLSFISLSQLGLVYFFEYVVSVGAADKANPSDDDSLPFEKKNAYVILSFCYQVGVLLSRSSLHLFKIRRVGWLTNLQGLNFILWIFIAKARTPSSSPSFVYVCACARAPFNSLCLLFIARVVYLFVCLCVLCLCVCLCRSLSLSLCVCVYCTILHYKSIPV